LQSDDPFGLVEADLVTCTIGDFGCPGRLVSRDLLCVFQRDTVLAVGGDAGGAKGVAAEWRTAPAGKSERASLRETLEAIGGSPSGCFAIVRQDKPSQAVLDLSPRQVEINGDNPYRVLLNSVHLVEVHSDRRVEKNAFRRSMNGIYLFLGP
jgi:hypothetical protein